MSRRLIDKSVLVEYGYAFSTALLHISSTRRRMAVRYRLPTPTVQRLPALSFGRKSFVTALLQQLFLSTNDIAPNNITSPVTRIY